MLAAAWLLRLTGEASYGEAALAHWRAEGPSVYVGWDSLYAPAVNVLLQLSSKGAPVPGAEEYENWWRQTFWPVWDKADGARGGETSVDECTWWQVFIFGVVSHIARSPAQGQCLGR